MLTTTFIVPTSAEAEGALEQEGALEGERARVREGRRDESAPRRQSHS